MEQIRNIIQPITHNLPSPIQKLGVSILGDKCYEKLLLQVDFGSIGCMNLAISKALGISIIGASTVVKVPQIIKLIKSRSASGISLFSYLLETFSYLMSLAYSIRKGFPFSTYGETGMVLLQNTIIACLILSNSGRANIAAVLVAGLAVVTYALFEPTVFDINILSYFQAAAGILGVTSKIPQIVTIWSEGETGQLSAYTVFSFLLGSLARVFTTVQEVDDKLILSSYIAGFLLNLLIALQMIYYWNVQTQDSKNVTLKEKIAVISSVPQTPAPKARSSSNRRRG